MEYHKTLNNQEYLIIKSENLDDIVAYINKKNVKSIYIDEYKGFKEKTLGFLSECLDVEKIFLNEGSYDITGIENLKNLKAANIGPKPNKPLDLSQFKYLESLSIDYHKNWLNLDKCLSMKDLRIWKFGFENLETISMLHNLRFLKLVQGNIKTLEGIDTLKLNHFEAHKVSGLKDIGVSKENLSLENFHLYDCKNVENHEMIKNAKKIKSLRYANCGEMESISFIQDLKELKEFRFPKTLVKDGDLSFLENIDVIMFNDKKHYSHKFKDLFLDRIKRGLMS